MSNPLVIEAADPVEYSFGNEIITDNEVMQSTKDNAKVKEEKWYHTTIQVSIPFFLAGIGTIGAGVILGHVEVRIVRNNHG